MTATRELAYVDAINEALQEEMRRDPSVYVIAEDVTVKQLERARKGLAAEFGADRMLVGVGTGAELVLFPVSGYLMDRYGRLFAMVPAFLLLAVGLVMLAVADSASTVGAASIVAGLGNGLSAGTLRTLSSDLAPLDSRAPFLAGMIAFQDLGRVLGLLVVGLTAHAVGLGGAAAVLAAVLLVGLAHIVLVVGETRDISPKPTR